MKGVVERSARYPGRGIAALALLAAWAFASAALAEDWPQWRGPTRDGRVARGAIWPGDFGNLTRTWRVDLGPGYSGPIVWGERVFVPETRDAKEEVVRALDRATGRELWRATWPGALNVPFFAKRNGDWIRATPACDGESLYVAGMRDVLVCLNAETGVERWRVDFPRQYETAVPAFGFVCSPLVLDDHVYVQAGAAFVKLNKRTGEVVWRTLADSGGMDSAFSSPVMGTIHGMRQLLVQTRQQIAGVAPETGEVLWAQEVPAFRGMNILTPTVFGDGIFTSSYKNKTFFYRVEKNESSYRVSEAWTTKAQGYMSSPVVVDEHAYLHLGNGRVCCVNLLTGEETWRSQSFGQYWSMVSNGTGILALDERGEVVLIAADPRGFRLLDRKNVAEAEAWAHLAVCGDELFVRDQEGISAWRWK